MCAVADEAFNTLLLEKMLIICITVLKWHVVSYQMKRIFAIFIWKIVRCFCTEKHNKRMKDILDNQWATADHLFTHLNGRTLIGYIMKKNGISW